MFNWIKRLFGGTPKAEPPGDSGDNAAAIAFLLLRNTTFPFDKLAAPLAQVRPAGKKVSDIEISDGMLMCTVDGLIVALLLMPSPVPSADLEGPCATSWMWPKGTSPESVKSHKGHILATAMSGKLSPVETRLILSQIIALVAGEPDLMGIYWPEAGMVHHPAIFAEHAQGDDAADLLAVNMWIDFRMGKNPDGTSSCFTQGLSFFGLMEMEFPKSSKPPGELREWMQNIAKYTIDNGPILLHGQTLGGSAEEKIKIIHTKSSHGAEGKVVRLEE